MQQESFSFFLFSAKRGGTSPNAQGRLSCWFDQLENIAFQAEYFLLSQNTLVHASADGRKSAGESPDGAMMWPMCKCFSPWVTAMWMMCKKPCCDYIHMEGATKMATKDIECPTIHHHYRESWVFSQIVSQTHHSYEKPRMVSISSGRTLHDQIEC